MRRRGQRPDATLATAAGAGDAAAFAELYERHAAAIHGYCRRVLRSPEEAADATHEAFVSVLERLRDGSRPVLAPRAYLFRAAHNACLRIAAGRRRVVRSEAAIEAGYDGDLSESERIVLTRELQDDVRTANAQLSLRQREVLALREVEHLPYDAIAQVMGITPNAAAQLAWRARANLRHRLRRRAFTSITLETLECQRALELFELAEDGALSVEEDRWLAGHVVSCSRCAGNRAVLAEVGATYRAWVPAGAVPLLTLELLRQAGQAVGAAWGTGSAAATIAAGAAPSTGAVAAGLIASAPSAVVATAVGLAVAAGGVAFGVAPGGRDSRVSAIAAVPTPLAAVVKRSPAPRTVSVGRGRLTPLGAPPAPTTTVPASPPLTAQPPVASVAPAAPSLPEAPADAEPVAAPQGAGAAPARAGAEPAPGVPAQTDAGPAPWPQAQPTLPTLPGRLVPSLRPAPGHAVVPLPSIAPVAPKLAPLPEHATPPAAVPVLPVPPVPLPNRAPIPVPVPPAVTVPVRPPDTASTPRRPVLPRTPPAPAPAVPVPPALPTAPALPPIRP